MDRKSRDCKAGEAECVIFLARRWEAGVRTVHTVLFSFYPFSFFFFFGFTSLLYKNKKIHHHTHSIINI